MIINGHLHYAQKNEYTHMCTEILIESKDNVHIMHRRVDPCIISVNGMASLLSMSLITTCVAPMSHTEAALYTWI